MIGNGVLVPIFYRCWLYELTKTHASLPKGIYQQAKMFSYVLLNWFNPPKAPGITWYISYVYGIQKWNKYILGSYSSLWFKICCLINVTSKLNICKLVRETNKN